MSTGLSKKVSSKKPLSVLVDSVDLNINYLDTYTGKFSEKKLGWEDTEDEAVQKKIATAVKEINANKKRGVTHKNHENIELVSHLMKCIMDTMFNELANKSVYATSTLDAGKIKNTDLDTSVILSLDWKKEKLALENSAVPGSTDKVVTIKDLGYIQQLSPKAVRLPSGTIGFRSRASIEASSLMEVSSALYNGGLYNSLKVLNNKEASTEFFRTILLLADTLRKIINT